MKRKSVDRKPVSDKMADMSNVPLENLVGVTEAAHELNVHRSLIPRYCRQGRLRATRAPDGRTWLIERTSLREFAAQARPVGNPNFSSNRS
jgi:excisionase family DNA binding protein